MDSCTHGVNGASVSSDSTTTGVSSGGSVGLLKKCLLKTQGFVGALVSVFDCQDDGGVETQPGRTDGSSRDAHQPSSMGTGRQAESACLGAQYGPQLLSLSPQESVPGGRRSLRQLDLGCPNTRNFGPSNDTPIPDQSIRRRGPLVPILPRRPS